MQDFMTYPSYNWNPERNRIIMYQEPIIRKTAIGKMPLFSSKIQNKMSHHYAELTNLNSFYIAAILEIKAILWTRDMPTILITMMIARPRALLNPALFIRT